MNGRAPPQRSGQILPTEHDDPTIMGEQMGRCDRGVGSARIGYIDSLLGKQPSTPVQTILIFRENQAAPRFTRSVL